MAVYTFQGKTPVVGKDTYVHPEATLIGDVIIGENCFIAPGARLRGDWGSIIVGNDCNIQDNCVIHSQPGKKTIVGNRGHIAHGAILHGVILEENVFVGMNCVIMDDALLKKDCCIAAGALVAANTVVEENALVMGIPGKTVKYVDEKMRKNIEWGREQYIALPALYLK